ncbi:MAG: acyl-CoA dehydrogenase [Rhodospirillaceae bacterium]|jgi:alkylation response protein AidB-like acyl-CoA dehydrogenase|nr:acyl-CoA dehydrogenase [Rhodospirillaceae bacterium]MBT4042452.1 acyl-CoA dehydrogenase [Rhodospirillaceae bacterium]MBT4687205.1 acyl-CoA dehydrogenase [Rhodospirillaceae bacterium]MBT5082764.1 acyl-CoA dehydrogenase [Rhodospirillaceae bacterium]MBT5524072.1 acyl-CoA dehydrogenase [Rhodospirillaceae bacterium]
MSENMDWTETRAKVKSFIEDVVYPLENGFDKDTAESQAALKAVQQQAKDAGLWALGHPKDIGGQGMPFMDYVHVNEVIGRSHLGSDAVGANTLQDSIMLRLYASPEWKKNYMEPLIAGEFRQSFAMTEPEVASSDPTGIETSAVQDGNHWVINGHKWFTSGADRAKYTTVMVRTEPDAPDHEAFSMIIVPTDNPGYNIQRDIRTMGMLGGHMEVKYENCRVPATNMLGERGEGFKVAQERLGPGRIFHCMRWLGQAQRAFDIMCERLNSRMIRDEKLGDKQLMQAMVFESAAEIQQSRLMTLDAARKMDAGDQARVEISLIKVTGARMLHNVIDRAIQVLGARGVTDDTPLERMYRQARFARLVDGADEVHIYRTGRRILRAFERGEGYDFGEREGEVAHRSLRGES